MAASYTKFVVFGVAVATRCAFAQMKMDKAFATHSSDVARETAEMAAWMRLSPGSTVCE